MPSISLYFLNPFTFCLNLIFAAFVVFSGRRNPAGTWAWLILVLVVPYLGFVLYLILGFDGRKHKVFQQKAEKDHEIYNNFLNMGKNNIVLINDQIDIIKRKNILNIEASEHLDDMIFLNLIAGGGAYTDNNSLIAYHDGNAKFDKLIKDIESSQHFIHLEYYIVRNDDLAKKLVSALSKKASEGVEVCFLIDGMGCARTSKSLFKPLLDAGGKLAIFLPPSFIRLNFRDHRKIAVIDGNIGYIGGLNIGDEYLGKVKRYGPWRDVHLRIIGDAVKQLELRFIMDWNFTTKDYPITLQNKYFPEMNDNLFSHDISQNIPIQIVSSGPDTKWHSIQYAYAKMISEANESIYIQSPYFVPDDSVFEALKVACLSGIDVKIMIPAHPDHPFVYWAALSYLGELLEAGVKCYQYQKGFVHSKLIIVDGLVSSVGTANLDVRSFKLNFEVNAFIYDKETAENLEYMFFEDIQHSTEITEALYNKRSNFTKIKESVSRLLSPIL